MASLREAEDGEAFPSPAAVFHEFRAMIAALREDKNGDRARVQDKADKKFAELEDVLADPSALYKLHRFSRSPGFQLFIYFCIAAVTVTSGLETSRALGEGLSGLGARRSRRAAPVLNRDPSHKRSSLASSASSASRRGLSPSVA